MSILLHDFKMIRSTKHFFSHTNPGKISVLTEILQEYKRISQLYINHIWSAKFENLGNVTFDISNDLLSLPKYLNYNDIKVNTTLSARLQSTALNQALGVIRGRIAIRSKLVWIINKRKSEGLSVDYYEKKLVKNILTKPILNDNFSMELNSMNIDFKESNGYFNLFMRLKSSGFNKINLPIKLHKQNKKWLGKPGSKRLAGVLISNKCIQLRYDIPDPVKKTTGKIVGGDTGYKTLLTLSDGQATPGHDKDGHSLDSICTKLSRKKKGSVNFEQAQRHRTNFINWSINQLNLEDIKQINLEEVVNIFYKRPTSKKLARWTNADIERKILSKAIESGVQTQLQPSTYRSQRCSGCGIVRKSNRRGKIYECKFCGLSIDADLNGALNHEIELPPLPYDIRQMKLNISGFRWNPEGIFNLSGEELTVPQANKR